MFSNICRNRRYFLCFSGSISCFSGTHHSSTLGRLSLSHFERLSIADLKLTSLRSKCSQLKKYSHKSGPLRRSGRVNWSSLINQWLSQPFPATLSPPSSVDNQHILTQAVYQPSCYARRGETNAHETNNQPFCYRQILMTLEKER